MGAWIWNGTPRYGERKERAAGCAAVRRDSLLACGL